MGKTGTYKNWLMLCYPDEAYENWFRRLDNLSAEIAISPLHENDKWIDGDRMIDNPRCGQPADLGLFNRSLKFLELFKNWKLKHLKEISDDGELPVDQIYSEGKPKKPHYHIILRFSGSKSQEEIEKIACECIAPAPPKPFKCDSISGAVRYLVHYDNPDKEQFAISSIQTLHGFDIAKYFKPTVAQEDELMSSIVHICRSNDLYSFDMLIDWLCVRAVKGDFLEEYRYTRTHCNLVGRYVDSIGKYRRYKQIDDNDVEQRRALKLIADILNEKLDKNYIISA